MKISRFSVAIFTGIALLFANNSFADWDVEAYQDDVIVQDNPAWPMPYNDNYAEESVDDGSDYYQDEYVEEEENVWPMPYTDTYTDIDTLAENPDYSSQKEQTTNVMQSKEPDTGWTGGPSYTPPYGNPPVTEGIIPPADSNMPLANKELVVDDGVRVLSASMPPGYPLIEEEVQVKEVVMETEETQILQDSVRDWIAKEGQTLREVLQQWADIEGWELVWNTKREYPLKASAIFRGRFKDVSAAIIRSFSRATPQPLAKYYLGNRVLLIKTLEENDG